MNDDLKYFDSKEFQEILTRYEQMRDSGGMRYMDADDLADVADYYSIVRHDDKSANEAIDLALSLHPDAVAPYIFKARQCLIAKKFDEAETIIESISEQDNREVVFLRAETLICRSQNDEALGFILHIDDSTDIQDRDFFLYDAAYVFIDYDCTDEAAVLAERLEAYAPRWFRTWELKADILLAKEQFQEALPYLEQMLDIDAFCIDAWNWRAEAYGGMEDYDEALESVENALAIEPGNLRARLLKAWYLLRVERYEEAHELYLQLRTDDADNEDNSVYDSYALLALDRPVEALEAMDEAFDRARKNDNDDSPADRSANTYELYQQKALCLGTLERPQEAISCLDNGLLAWNGEVPPNVMVDALLLKMRVWAQNNDIKRAAEAYRQAVECDDEHTVEAFYRGAQILFEFSYDDEAIEAFTTVLKVTDDTVLMANSHAYIAASLDAHNRPEEALPHLREAIDLNAENLEMLFAEKLPEGVKKEEYYDYYYYKAYGKWPQTT